MNLLIIEDDNFLANKIKSTFEKKVLVNRVKVLSTYKEFLLEKYIINSYDLIMVDILLGDKQNHNGIDIIKIIRTKNKVLPIIIISGLDDIKWLKLAFDTGASDYICKPFRLAELEVRTTKWFNIFLGNGKLLNNNFIEYNGLIYDFTKNIFLYSGKEIFLTKLIKYVLVLFISNKEKLLREDYLIEKIWGDYNLVDRNLRIIIFRLKTFLKPYGIDIWIKNIRGEGYILKKK